MYEIKKRIIDTVWGKPLTISYRENTNDLDVARAIATFNEYHVDFFSYEDGDTFIDLGSHVGIWSILMALHNSTFKVISYEAIPENYEMIKRNMKNNNLNNVYPFNIAISDSKIYYPYNPQDSFVSTHRWIGSPQGGTKYITVPSISLNDVFNKHNISRCRVLKTDIEGSEVHAFLDLTKENLAKIDYVIGEFHPWGIGMDTFFSYFKDFVDISRLIYPENKRNFDLQNFLFKRRDA